jgi:5-methylcytosine-specific restriction endonuclease McrA
MESKPHQCDCGKQFNHRQSLLRHAKECKQEELRKIKEQQEENIKKNEEVKKRKQSIPKNVRIIVWNHYIGEYIIQHRCLCCKKVLISNTNFEVGHVQSEKNGGTHEINNLRPICFACNHSMGTENMIDFVVKYGLYIG